MKNALIYEKEVQIPTYKIHAPEKCPFFIERRAYQGSSGRVYPLPVTEKLGDEKELMAYKALILENEYLHVMILPELGGRIQRAYDKTNGYDFVYYNHVIKPALVGLTGPWISGGIEFNWPQHHRPSTFSPVDYSYRENEDGSVSAFVGETDVMYGTKALMTVTLYPGRAYIEIKGQLYNPTDFPQTFLWWANPAVAVNDNTFSVFPPDVDAVMDHGKRAVSTFPIATGEYYKYDYSEGVDISRYKNIRVPTSYMAASSNYDFIGNFDEGRDAGLLHIADHHVAPGKKQWTWGCGDFGKMWDKNLTDEDGPYIELMTGVFTDNQPDFSWLKPQEEKCFTQYFMPYKTVGRVSNATKDVVIGICGQELRVYATGVFEGAEIRITSGEREIYQRTVSLSPEKCFVDSIPALQNYLIQITDHAGRLLGEYREWLPQNRPLPEPAEALKAPEELKSQEELFLAGQHLEQYRHATFNPADYYLEGLKRDKTDIRLNNAYGLLLLKNGLIRESITFFQEAVKKQTWRNPNPYDGECFYNLGIAYALLQEEDSAYDAFYKASWNAETQGSSFYHLACISTKRGEYEKALEFIRRSLSVNYHNMKARSLQSEIMAALGIDNTALLQESYELDRLSFGILYQYLSREDFKAAMGGRIINYLKLSLEYMQFGLFEKAIAILELCPGISPLTEYYKGYANSMAGCRDDAVRCYERAESLPEDYCFPSSLEEMLILENAIAVLPQAPMAHYYLGCLLYDKKQYQKAAENWEAAVSLKPALAMAWRNLSIAYYNREQDTSKALNAMARACELEQDNSRFLLEQDQLFSRAGISCAERLRTLEAHRQLLEDRDALCLAYITLLNLNQRCLQAYELLSRHRFHVWEGGEGKIAEQYKISLFALAEQAMAAGKYEEALSLAEKTLVYPNNLGEGKLPNVPDNQACYLMGRCHKLLGRPDKAQECFTLAAAGGQTPAPVLYYNDQPSDYIYYQGLAFHELGQVSLAKKSFHQLIAYGKKHLFDKVEYDFFAVSLPELEVYTDDLQARSRDYCLHLIALGERGLREISLKQEETTKKG